MPPIGPGPRTPWSCCWPGAGTASRPTGRGPEMVDTELKPPTYEPGSYRFFRREEVAELRELAATEHEARAAFEATLSDEQKRLAYKLRNARDEFHQQEHYFAMRAMIRHLAEH